MNDLILSNKNMTSFYLQKINPETFELLHIYETVEECIKEDNSLKSQSINKAVQENTIYGGFRWQIVDCNLDPTIIKPTKVANSEKWVYCESD